MLTQRMDQARPLSSVWPSPPLLLLSPQRDMLASPGALRVILPPWEALALQRPDSLSTPALTARPFVDLLQESSFLILGLFWILHEEGELGTHEVLMKPATLSQEPLEGPGTDRIAGRSPEVEGHWSLLPPESWLGRPQRNHRACCEGVRI